jgi:hypothetical protein
LTLPLHETDETILSVLEGEVLGTAAISDLLRLVDTGAAAVHDGLVAQRDGLKTEVDRLVASIAVFVPPQTVAPLIRQKEAEGRTDADVTRLAARTDSTTTRLMPTGGALSASGG